MTENENKTEVPSVKTPEELKLIVSEIDKEVATEVESDLVQQNQGETEPKELTEEEKRANLIQAIKESKIKFHPIKHAVAKTISTNTVARPFGGTRKVKEKVMMTNLTSNQFGAAYKKERKRKNKMQKASRKLNRKK